MNNFKNYFRLANPDWEKNNNKFWYDYNGKSVAGDDYRDADAVSPDLYIDLKKSLFTENYKQLLNAELCEKFNNKYRIKLKVANAEYQMSSDYIGASWAIVRLDEEEILEMLSISRTLGGHILFPVGKKGWTVNQARGMCRYKDRLDLTLWAIKDWYDRRDKSNTPISNAINRYADWFELFLDENKKNGFNNFITFFRLEDWVEKKNFIPYDLVNSDFEKNVFKILENEEFKRFDKNDKDDKDVYRRYIKNCNELIQKRTMKLLEK